MGGPKSDVPPEQPPWELPEPEESQPELPPGEDELIPDKSESELFPEISATPEEDKTLVSPAESLETEAIAPEQPSELPSWIARAESEPGGAEPAFPAGPPEPIAAEDLKAAPDVDLPVGVAKAAETLATRAAPLSALPAADKKMEAPSPVFHPEEAKPLKIVEVAQTADEQVVLDRITEPRRVKLMALIDDILDQIYDRLSAETNQRTLEEVLKLLKAARHTLIENPRDYDTAEYYTLRAKTLLDRFQSVRRESYRWVGIVILIYEVLLGVLVILGFIFSESLTGTLIRAGIPEWTVAPWSIAMASACGAVLGALWALVEHAAIRQDFDKQHRLWYYASPVKGFLLGIAIYFMMHAGTLAMGLSTPIGEGGTLLEPDWFLLTLAFLIGFQQNVALELFERFVKLIRPARTPTATS